jgi:hypothetical protein
MLAMKMPLKWSLALCALGLSACAWVQPDPVQTIAVKVTDAKGEAVPNAFCRAANDRGVWPFVAPGQVTVPRSDVPLDITCERDSLVGFVRALPHGKVWSPTDLTQVGGLHEAMDPLRYPTTDYPQSVDVVMGQDFAR